MSRVLVLRPSAKINLTLRVGDCGADGYHDVRTLLQSISISDRLTLTPRKGPFTLVSRSPGVPTDATNLVWKAAARVWSAIGRSGEPRDAHVRLDKAIPVAAGLGGGSADAAAAVLGFHEIWGGRLSKPVLFALAAELGADVPFFLVGGTALGAGRGDELYPIDDVPRMNLVVMKPSFGVPTKDAYRWLDEDRTAGLHPTRPLGTVDLGWTRGPIELKNDLEGPVARRHPMIDEMLGALKRAGATAAGMTGSGSAVFAVCPPALVKRGLARLARPDWLVVLCRTLTRREAARRMGLW
jgi:4-diphosphocytidyl-2-C-methyl-D-erythritol kinase